MMSCMRSTVLQALPISLRRSLAKLGGDLNVARRRRGLTVKQVAERLGAAQSTYLRIERGDPTVSVAAYAMAIFVLGFGTPLGDLADPRNDDQGTLLAEEHLPKRVRPTQKPTRT